MLGFLNIQRLLRALPAGAPPEACRDMTPQHPPFSPQQDDSGYQASVSRQGRHFTSKLSRNYNINDNPLNFS